MEKSLKYKCIVKMRAWAKYLQTLLTKWYPHWLTIYPMSLGYFTVKMPEALNIRIDVTVGWIKYSTDFF